MRHERLDRRVLELAEQARLPVVVTAGRVPGRDQALHRAVRHRGEHLEGGAPLAERRERALAGLDRPDVAGDHGQDRLAAHLLGHELLGRRAQDRRAAADLVRRVLHEAAVGLEQVDGRVDREQHHSAVDERADLVQRELEARDHPEVAAAALQRPEQIRVAVGARDQQPAVRGDDLGRQEAVDREPVLALDPAAAAAEREPADAGVRQPAARDREPEGLRLVVDLAPVGSAAAPRRAPLGVDAHSVHRSQVDLEAAVDDGMPGDRMAAAPHRNVQVVLARQRESGHDVGGAGAARDRAPASGRWRR